MLEAVPGTGGASEELLPVAAAEGPPVSCAGALFGGADAGLVGATSLAFAHATLAVARRETGPARRLGPSFVKKHNEFLGFS